MVLYKKIFIR